MTSSLDPFQISNVAALFLPSVSSLNLSHSIETLNESRGKPSSSNVLAQGFECLRKGSVGGVVPVSQAWVVSTSGEPWRRLDSSSCVVGLLGFFKRS